MNEQEDIDPIELARTLWPQISLTPKQEEIIRDLWDIGGTVILSKTLPTTILFPTDERTRTSTTTD